MRDSILWQVLPYVLLTLGEVLVSATGLEFAYSQAPAKLKGVLMSFFNLSVTVGNLWVLVANAVVKNDGVVAAIERTLQTRGVPYMLGKTWTTDAIFRETPAKVQLRRSEGCLTVEMEAAAFFAVAQFRGVTFAQMLYGGDDVSGAEWDARGWSKRMPVRERLFWLAAEACLAI